MTRTKKAKKIVSHEDATVARIKGIAWSWANHAAEIYREDPNEYAAYENGAELCLDCCVETLAGDAIRSGEMTREMVDMVRSHAIREFDSMDLSSDE